MSTGQRTGKTAPYSSFLTRSYKLWIEVCWKWRIGTLCSWAPRHSRHKDLNCLAMALEPTDRSPLSVCSFDIKLQLVSTCWNHRKDPAHFAQAANTPSAIRCRSLRNPPQASMEASVIQYFTVSKERTPGFPPCSCVHSDASMCSPLCVWCGATCQCSCYVKLPLQPPATPTVLRPHSSSCAA